MGAAKHRGSIWLGLEKIFVALRDRRVRCGVAAVAAFKSLHRSKIPHVYPQLSQPVPFLGVTERRRLLKRYTEAAITNNVTRTSCMPQRYGDSGRMPYLCAEIISLWCALNPISNITAKVSLTKP